MVTIDWTEDAGWHDAQLVPYGPIPFDPATNVLHYGQAIFEGLKAYRQPDGSIATFRPEANAAPLPALGAPAGDARAARGAVPRLDRGARRARTQAYVPADAREVAVPAAVHVLDRGRSRRASGQRVPLPADRLAGRRVLPAAACKPVTVWLSTRVRRARRPAAPARRSARGNYAASLRRPGPGRREGLRPGRLARRGRAPLGRGDGRHEPVLRVRLRRGRPHRHPRAHRQRCCRASPATRCCTSPRTSATAPRRAGSARTSGRPATPPARSPRSSRAAPPPSSRRSARSRAPTRRGRVGDGSAGPGDDAAARGAARHPDRRGRGPARLDAPAGPRSLTGTAGASRTPWWSSLSRPESPQRPGQVTQMATGSGRSSASVPVGWRPDPSARGLRRVRARARRGVG